MEIQNNVMANSYYLHHSAANPQEASIFSDEYTWNIFNVLRKAGARGLTSQEIHQQMEKTMRIPISRSKVYGLLKRLYQQRWVHRYYDKDVESQRITIALNWGGILVEKNFNLKVIEKESVYMVKKLFPLFVEYLTKSMRDLFEDTATKKWLPQRGPYCFCKICGISHEAEEFFSSILDIAISEFIISDSFKDLMKKNGFAEEETTELLEGYTGVQAAEKRASRER